ncbi:hypothetical protein NEDG_01497 [Nematocida displodere]|uniref:Uncharacterized protein n=1 Tax=Nematocida displodere TaxID=1805483 RepID=A0A177EEW6_9MICR|nr:hypothetical protein NEDG_01497 [Nematocida displodere]
MQADDTSARERKVTIADIEEKLLKAREWYELGEVTQNDRPKNSLISPEMETGGEIEVIRSKSTLKTEDLSQELEVLLRNRIKEKKYDNRRKTVLKENVLAGKEEIDIPRAPRAPEPPRAPLHDAYEGRTTANDKFMDKTILLQLFNEIEKDLINLGCGY